MGINYRGCGQERERVVSSLCLPRRDKHQLHRDASEVVAKSSRRKLPSSSR